MRPFASIFKCYYRLYQSRKGFFMKLRLAVGVELLSGYDCIASGQHQKEMFSRYGFHRAIGIAILAYMVTWHRWSRLFTAPAPFRLVDSSKTSLVLKHQPYTSCRVRRQVFSGFQHAGFNFFEASHASSLAAFGCFDLGITFRHPCRSNSI